MRPVDEYLSLLVTKVRAQLGSNLIGLYQIGSICFDDYIDGQSDIDLIGVVLNKISDQQKDDLANTLKHSNFECPAQGLDFVILRQEVITSIANEPPYEFWYSTGALWPDENWQSGACKEMLIFIELFRKHSLILYGEKPKPTLLPIDQRKILEVFIEMLFWHQNNLLDDFHDPGGQNSILNACRILAFAQDDQFRSKKAGGLWLIKLEPKNDMVRKALMLRLGKGKEIIKKEEITTFVEKVIRTLENIIHS